MPRQIDGVATARRWSAPSGRFAFCRTCPGFVKTHRDRLWRIDGPMIRHKREHDSARSLFLYWSLTKVVGAQVGQDFDEAGFLNDATCVRIPPRLRRLAPRALCVCAAKLFSKFMKYFHLLARVRNTGYCSLKPVHVSRDVLIKFALCLFLNIFSCFFVIKLLPARV